MHNPIVQLHGRSKRAMRHQCGRSFGTRRGRVSTTMHWTQYARWGHWRTRGTSSFCRTNLMTRATRLWKPWGRTRKKPSHGNRRSQRETPAWVHGWLSRTEPEVSSPLGSNFMTPPFWRRDKHRFERPPRHWRLRDRIYSTPQRVSEPHTADLGFRFSRGRIRCWTKACSLPTAPRPQWGCRPYRTFALFACNTIPCARRESGRREVW
mmetsp:Transcript_45898/g.99427  ORF Transcript_45898/g.99427 Transcript_45898/m.99427 type:complete len:208 (-) Transcript_45898:574-1197(-)